jgi:low temperature requirement protein LtrA
MGWILQIILNFRIEITIVLSCILAVIELAGPYIAEKKDGGTPWHAHHIAERYSLFAIIAMGEGVVGTIATLSAVIQEHGWTMDAALVCIAGIGLTFGMWWIYFMLPSAPILHAHRDRSFDRGRIACRGLFHRAPGPHRPPCDGAERRHSSRYFSRLDL